MEMNRLLNSGGSNCHLDLTSPLTESFYCAQADNISMFELYSFLNRG